MHFNNSFYILYRRRKKKGSLKIKKIVKIFPLFYAFLEKYT